MTADLGIGANLVVESVVTLCNILHRELKSNPNRHFDTTELKTLFQEYQNERYERMSKYVELSGQVTRMRAYTTLFGRIMVSYVAPLMMKGRTMKFAESLAQAPKLDYVPTRTINENAAGWKLANKKDGSTSSSWLVYVVLTSTVGLSIAYAASAGLLPKLF